MELIEPQPFYNQHTHFFRFFSVGGWLIDSFEREVSFFIECRSDRDQSGCTSVE